MTAFTGIRRSVLPLVISVACVFFTSISCSDSLLDEQERILAERNRPIVSPPEGRTVTMHETLTFTFPISMDPASVSVSGTLGSSFSPVWDSKTSQNDTMILNQAGDNVWSEGSNRTVVVTVVSGVEQTVYTYTYGIFRGICVSEADPFPDDGYLPDDSGPGTALQPMVTIPAAITLAQTKYGTCSIHVAAATYETDWYGSAASRITMVEGISLLGGYSVGWVSQNPTSYVTRIEDASSAGGSVGDPNRAVYIGAGITSATHFEGFSVQGGLGDQAAAVMVWNASPVIRNCIIQAGGNGADVQRFAVYAGGTSSLEIRGCRINPDGSGGGNTIRICCGIYFYQCSGYPIIADNGIEGGNAYTGSTNTPRTYGIYSNYSNCYPTIIGNSIKAGTGYNTYGIYIRFSNLDVLIANNLILSGNSGTGGSSWCISYDSMQALVRNNTIRCGDASGYCAAAYGIQIPLSANLSAVENNIFIRYSETGDYPIYGIYEGAAASGPDDLHNNDFVNFPNDAYHTVYYDFETSTALKTVAAMEAALAGYTGNTDATPVLDGNFRITNVIPTSVTQGGIDGAAAAWGFTTDRDGATRTGDGTTGWSMGCYERD